MPNRHVQVIVACSDHRMNPRIKQEIAQNEQLNIRTVPIRAAGGDIRTATETLRDVLDNNRVASILILTHGDCKYRTARFDALRSTGSDLNIEVTAPKASTFTSLSHFETYDNDAILQAMHVLVAGRKEKYEIKLEQVDISGINAPNGKDVKHILEIGQPDSTFYKRGNDELMGRYMLSTTRGLDERTGDVVEFFVNRGIVEEIVFAVAENAHRNNAALDRARLMMAPWMVTNKKVKIGPELFLRV